MAAVTCSSSARHGAPPFDWKRQWYPLSVKGCTDPSRPHRAKLFGEDLVVWFDAAQQRWRCFKDACPHRLAPLSEGRVEKDGTLMCSYHAWRFDGHGACTSMPQSRDEKRTTACSRSRAKSFPTREDQGLLWVWACPDDPGASESHPPRLVPELSAGNAVMTNTWVHRDLPYGWDYFFENVTDSSHGAVSHHGLLGDRNKDALPVTYHTVDPLSDDEGFSARWNNTMSRFTTNGSDYDSSLTTFSPPCLLRVDNFQKNGSNSMLVLYATPTTPGRCLFIGANVLVKASDGTLPSSFSLNVAPMPVWLGHLLASIILHQDLCFIYRQQYAIRASGLSWRRACYMPCSADKATVLFRVWLERNGPIPWVCDDSLPPLIEDSRALFDVYHTHTKNCVQCSRALRRFETARNVLAACAATTQELSLALVLGCLALGAHAIARLFYVYEFSHQDNE